MYDILIDIIGFPGELSTTLQSVVTYCSCVLIIIAFVVLIDLLYRIFRHFWR